MVGVKPSPPVAVATAWSGGGRAADRLRAPRGAGGGAARTGGGGGAGTYGRRGGAGVGALEGRPVRGPRRAPPGRHFERAGHVRLPGVDRVGDGRRRGGGRAVVGVVDHPVDDVAVAGLAGARVGDVLGALVQDRRAGGGRRRGAQADQRAREEQSGGTHSKSARENASSHLQLFLPTN